MADPPYSVQLATAADRPTVRSLLVAAELPVEDLDAVAHRLTFWVARGNAGPIAAIGLERYGPIGLLRSLVVAPDHRRHGLGRELVRVLERHANAAGIEELVLLTETAEPFFRRLGYAVMERSRAPAAVTESAEFHTLCPAIAVCMDKRLQGGGVAVCRA